MRERASGSLLLGPEASKVPVWSGGAHPGRLSCQRPARPLGLVAGLITAESLRPNQLQRRGGQFSPTHPLLLAWGTTPASLPPAPLGVPGSVFQVSLPREPSDTWARAAPAPNKARRCWGLRFQWVREMIAEIITAAYVLTERAVQAGLGDPLTGSSNHPPAVRSNQLTNLISADLPLDAACLLGRTACHEAGHAVAALSLGLPLNAVEIRSDGTGVVGYRRWLGPAELERWIITAYAGGASERSVFPFGSCDNSLDRTRVARAVDKQRKHWSAYRLDALRQEACRLVERERRAVLAVAAALVEYRYLNAEGVGYYARAA